MVNGDSGNSGGLTSAWLGMACIEAEGARSQPLIISNIVPPLLLKGSPESRLAECRLTQCWVVGIAIVEREDGQRDE